MGSLTSFLCCGSDAASDSDDKYQKQNASRNGPARKTAQNHPVSPSSKKGNPSEARPTRSNGTVTSSPQKTPVVVAKSAIEDDNSVNESDTLTVPPDETQKLEHKKENPVPETPATSAPLAPETQTQNASASQNQRELEKDAQPDADNDASFDLSAMQENQAYNPETGFLLGKKDTSRFGNKKCLVLDLDETLVHSSFKYLRTADFVIPVEIEDQVHHVYVIKRPGVDEFLRKVGQWYEVVVFTASVAKYGDPLLNKLDVHHSVHQRLFRDSCYSYQGNFIKNLSQLGRPLEDSIIIDNSPASYIFHPQHSVPISSWFSDTHDNELLDLLPLLEDLSKPNVDDVSLVLDIGM